MKNSENLPEKYRPLSMWAYFGYNLLYSIPLIGWIFLIVFSFDNSNINRRNYSRSFFVVFIISAIFALILLTSGALASFINAFIPQN